VLEICGVLFKPSQIWFAHNGRHCIQWKFIFITVSSAVNCVIINSLVLIGLQTNEAVIIPDWGRWRYRFRVAVLPQKAAYRTLSRVRSRWLPVLYKGVSFFLLMKIFAWYFLSASDAVKSAVQLG
jgi:hypothetical protein